MKKALALITAVCLIAVCFVIPVSAENEPDTVYNLVPDDATITYSEVSGVKAEATFDSNGVLTVKAAGAWPGVTLEYAVPYTFEIAKATLKVKFSLSSGGTSIRIGTPNSTDTATIDEIFVHHYIDGMTFDGAGDLATAGVYEFEIPFSDLFYCDWTEAASYTGKLPIEGDEITLSFIEIYSVNGAEIVIEKLEVVVEGDEIINISEDTSEEASETVSEETSESSTPETGDSGIVALAIITVASLTGAIAIKRKH